MSCGQSIDKMTLSPVTDKLLRGLLSWTYRSINNTDLRYHTIPYKFNDRMFVSRPDSPKYDSRPQLRVCERQVLAINTAALLTIYYFLHKLMVFDSLSIVTTFCTCKSMIMNISII